MRTIPSWEFVLKSPKAGNSGASEGGVLQVVLSFLII
jgi:hypothetical protein|tara:strand:- start:737 stop:847 length:111 start_codon:yes stop_codon:yes gene_type:complete